MSICHCLSFARPHRLSVQTHELASRYLSGEIGRTLMAPDFALDPDFFLEVPSANRHYAEAVRLIAARAPLRLLPGERLAGAATMLEALKHKTPLTPFGSISHTTVGFARALRLGCRGLRAELEARLADPALSEDARDFLTAARVCLDAHGTWHARYVALLEERLAANDDEHANYAAVLAALRPVPENPPATFREALQAIWFLWDFQRLCGNWSGLGRLDQMLGPFLERDLAAGRLTLDEARELLAHFWIKGCEWITASGRGSGDAQFYQNVVLAGVDAEGQPVANAVTDLILDVVEELPISDFPIAVRLSAQSPERLYRRVAEIQRHGGGIVAIYNDDRIILMLHAFGYPLAEARDFANDGCWELLIPGKTRFGYQPFDTLQILQDSLGLNAPEAPAPAFADFEALYADFRRRLALRITELVREVRADATPAPLLSLLVEGCVAKGRSYLDGGPVYTVLAPHAGGLPDVANSLLVLRTLVYDERRFTLPEFIAILRADWAGHEDLRQAVQARFELFGNDHPESNAMLRRVFDEFTGLVAKVPRRHGVWRPAGISTFGREGIDFLPKRTAIPAGQKRGAILAPNLSASPGTDQQGPTAIIKSHCAVDFGRLPCGTALDLKLLPASVAGETGLQAMMALLRTFVQLGGIFMQIDVVDTALLRDAQIHPEKYPNLSVRVSGWSARFATLDKQWQDMIIARTQQQVR